MHTKIVGMGAFHTICNFLVTIGKRFEDTGLRDIAVESAVIAEGLIEAVLEGSQYNRTVRIHNIIYSNAKETQPFSIHFFFHLGHVRLIS